MANYTTATSDKNKQQVEKLFYMSAFGILGLHYFYVGKLKQGIIHLVISFFLIGITLTVWGSSVHTDTGAAVTILEKLGYTILIWGVCALAGIPTFIRIKLGKFRDNVGAPVRQ